MPRRHTTRMGWPSKAEMSAYAFAVLLAASVPVTLFAGVVVMLLGYVVAGLALFGFSVLAIAAIVAIAGLSGVRQMRRLSRQVDALFGQSEGPSVKPDGPFGQWGEPDDQRDEPGDRHDDRFMKLNRDDYFYE